MTIAAGLLMIVTLAIGWFGSYWLASHRNPLRIMDQPNERSLHEVPTPRAGGVAILLSLLVGWLSISFAWELPGAIKSAFIALIIVGGVSLLDDRWDISPLYRLLAQGAAAALLLIALPEEWFIMLGVWLGIVWMINLYNFMDGIDGLAGGMAVIGFGSLGLIAWVNGYSLFSVYAWVVSIASLGFLILNWPPARIFMGDVGSASLGLLVSVFSLWGVQENLFSYWIPLLIFSPFIVDATITLLRRAWNGEKVWEAHCSHYYQRLVRLGWGHRKTVLFEYCLMLICALCALMFNAADDVVISASIVIALGVVYSTIAVRIYYLEQERNSGQ